ncbi:hypothetical protein B0T11DRAFT_274762 [Plectosphaerella cucumerina]|uniref:Uncharacterized protein n=1 Tax=Plectosphaerella cucumerina TaxID=40658 RepID=A0A8K0TIR2_9PEZI|nr:hypothetical protein B0T11DRAFT_274762 [Plectosphaerella cucumerina]
MGDIRGGSRLGSASRVSMHLFPGSLWFVVAVAVAVSIDVGRRSGRVGRMRGGVWVVRMFRVIEGMNAVRGSGGYRWGRLIDCWR